MPFLPSKVLIFSRKRHFWPFCRIWWPPCATPWPHMTNFCNDSYCQVFLRRIPSRCRQSFHFFSFFFFNECEVSRFFRFGPFWLICRPPMGAPAPYLPVLVADTLVGANYLKNFIPNWYFQWFKKKKTCDRSVWPFFAILGLREPLLANMGIARLIRLAHTQYFCSL